MGFSVVPSTGKLRLGTWHHIKRVVGDLFEQLVDAEIDFENSLISVVYFPEHPLLFALRIRHVVMSTYCRISLNYLIVKEGVVKKVLDDYITSFYFIFVL